MKYSLTYLWVEVDDLCVSSTIATLSLESLGGRHERGQLHGVVRGTHLHHHLKSTTHTHLYHCFIESISDLYHLFQYQNVQNITSTIKNFHSLVRKQVLQYHLSQEFSRVQQVAEEGFGSNFRCYFTRQQGQTDQNEI